MDCEDDGAQDFSLSASCINPTTPNPSNLPLARINQPKGLVASGGKYVDITTKMHLNRSARRLPGNTGK
jgi:hypothetical protein